MVRQVTTIEDQEKWNKENWKCTKESSQGPLLKRIEFR